MSHFIRVCVAALFICPISAVGQTAYSTKDEAFQRFQTPDIYESECGWILHANDQITLGDGTLPRKSFAFITADPGIMAIRRYSQPTDVNLEAIYNGKFARIVSFKLPAIKIWDFSQ